MLARKHVKKYIEMSFKETLADVTAEKIWEVIGDFGAPGLLSGGWFDKILQAGDNKLGSQRTVVPARGWWCETAREETLVTRNAGKMWISFAIVGPKDTLGKSKYSDCAITWKVRPGDGGDGAVVACNVRCLPKGDFTQEQIEPSFSTEFKGTLDAALLAAKGEAAASAAADGEAAPAPEAAAPPGEEAPAAAAESDATPAPAAEDAAAPAAEAAPAADAPAE